MAIPFYYPIPEKTTKSKIVYDCNKCGLIHKQNIKHPKMKPYIGQNYNGIVIVANRPSKEDDIKGIPLLNDRAKLVRSLFFKNKINCIKDIAIVYAARCYNNKNTTDVQYKCCMKLLDKDLESLKPKLIITLGDMAFKSVMRLKIKFGAIKIRNRIIPNYYYNCLVFPIFDPNVINSYHYKFAMERDIFRISKLWNTRYRKRNVIKDILKKRKILDGITIHEVKTNEVKTEFDKIHKLKEVAFDYETTNANPYDSFFEITHISFSTEHYAWVFHEALWENDLDMWDLIAQHTIQFLTDPNVLKIIQNAKFEDQASRYVFKIKRLVNSFCTMLATHVIDERRGCTSLDFQNLTRFGIPPYSETIKQFIIPKSKDHKVNAIRNAPHNDMILYAGLDVITTYANWKVLKEDLLPNAYPEAFSNYEFLNKGHQVFANMSQRGIPIGEKEYSDLEDVLDNEINNTINKIWNLDKFQEFNKHLKKRALYGGADDAKPDEHLIQMLNTSKRKDNGNETFETGDTQRVKRSIGKINRKVSFT